jgi:flagellar hook-basal body complex protein FliE
MADLNNYLVDRLSNQSATPQTGTPAASGPVGVASTFSNALTSAVGNLAGLQANADQAVTGVALNQGVDIHQAMIAMEQASLGMHLAVQVRDKAVEAYQSLMNMQV